MICDVNDRELNFFLGFFFIFLEEKKYSYIGI